MFASCKSKKVEYIHPLDIKQIHKNEVDLFYKHKADSIITQINDININRFKKVATIGESSDSFEYYFFQTIPSKIDIDNSNRIYISRESFNSISVYNRDGIYIYSIGRGGRGPGEFQRVIDFEFSNDKKELYVLDFFEIEKFTLEGDEYVYNKSYPHNMLMVYDFCLLNDKMYLSGYRTKREKADSLVTLTTDEKLKKKVAPPISTFNLSDFTYLNSFGFEYLSNSGYGTFDGVLSKNYITCNPSTNTIIGYQADFSYIFGYNTLGEQKWVTKIADYINAEHTEFKSPEYKNTGLIQYSNSGIFNRKLPIPTINMGKYEILQFLYQTPQKYFADFDSSESKSNIETLLIDSESGFINKLDYSSKSLGFLNREKLIAIKQDQKTFDTEVIIYEKH